MQCHQSMTCFRNCKTKITQILPLSLCTETQGVCGIQSRVGKDKGRQGTTREGQGTTKEGQDCPAICTTRATSTLIRFRMPPFFIQRKRIQISASTLAMRKRYVFVLRGRLIIEFMTSAFSKTSVFGVFARPH